MKIYTRAEWGAKYQAGTGRATMPATSLWLHHTAGVAGTADATVAKDSELVRSIEQTGQTRFGAGISYTFIVTRSGRIFEGTGADRIGTHTKGLNTSGRAICLPGNYENITPTKGQLDAVAWLVAHGAKQGWWKDPKLSGGHRNAPGASTACPGKNAQAAIPNINTAALSASESVSAPVQAPTAAPATSPAPMPAGMAIVAPLRASTAQAQEWARSKGAHARFVNDIIPALYDAAEGLRKANGGVGIDPAVVVAQAAKETGWGRYSGVLSPDFLNTGGIKNAIGGGDFDPNAHQRFPSWAEGARAHLNHLAAYTGLKPVGTPHGRYHTVMKTTWAGSIKTVEQLGARWAPNPAYGTDLVKMVNDLLRFSKPATPTPTTPKPTVMPTLRRGSKGAEVLYLQQRLKSLNPAFSYSAGPASFGPATETEVKAFQRRKRLVVDGIVGPRTWAALGL